MIAYIIAADANNVYVKRRKLNHKSQSGKQQATRKNPHAIYVGSRQNIVPNYGYIMWMAIHIIAITVI